MADWSPVDLLPGLYAGALAILLWSALRRWYDPLPGRILAVFSLVLLVLFGPVLFGGKLLLPLDNLRGQVPFRHLPPVEPHGNLLQGDLLQLVAPSLAAVRTAFGEGRWPLWNPLVGAGMPLLADPQSQALQPIALAALPLPWWRAAGVMAALRVLLALTFSSLWMRRQGLGEGPALAGALAFGLGGFLLLWLGWPIANSAALLPAVLYALARCRRVGTRRDFLLLSLSLLALLLGGHPETVLYALGVALAFGSALALDLKRSVLALGIAAAVAAPALLPAIDYLPQTLRATRLGTPYPVGDLARHWLPIVVPNAYGNSRFVHYWGLSNTNEDAGGFVGTITLLAALLALWPGRRLPQERLFLGIAVLCLVLLSPWGPGTRRLLLPLAFSLSYLGACTLERVRLGEVRRWPVAVAAVLLGTVIAWGYLAHADPAAKLTPLRLGWLHWQGRFLVAGALLLVLGKGLQRHQGQQGRVSSSLSSLQSLLSFLIAAELLLAHLPANPPMPKRLLLPVNGPVRFLEDHLREGGRMAALGRDFPPNLPSLYGLADVRVYNPMAPAAYLRRLEPILTGWWGELPELGNPGHPLYRELGVRYILTAPGAQLPLRPVFQDEDAWIWEVPDPRPIGTDVLYRPASFLLGLLLAALGLAAGAALFVPPPTTNPSPNGGASRATARGDGGYPARLRRDTVG
jgi:hypothetical protein